MSTEHSEPTEPGEEEVTPEEKPEKKTPEFLENTPPRGKKKYCMWALMHDKTEDDLEAEGFNPGTVRIAAWELEKLGYRKRAKNEEKPKDLTTTGKVGVPIAAAKGMSPEALIAAMTVPISDGEAPIFEKGLKFGANIVVLGVRIAQELSAVGVQQAKPLIDMAKDMRSGEAAAAREAAGEAAMLAASQIQQNLQPYLANMAKPAEVDPMKSMMARTMEPIIQRLMGSMIPGAAPASPEGWTKRTE